RRAFCFVCACRECYAERGHRHSFPTRRSSDLGGARRHRGPAAGRRDRPPAARRRGGGGDRGAGGHGMSSSFPNTSPAASRRWASDRKSTRLNSSHVKISYAVFCLKKKKA